LDAPVYTPFQCSTIHQRRRFINDYSTLGNFTVKPVMIATASSYVERAIDSR